MRKDFFKNGILIIACVFSACTQKEDKASATPGITELPFTTLELRDLSAFKDPGENWSIVGNVFMNDHQGRSAEVKEGENILVGRFNDKPIQLSTVFEHEDIDLKMDFMLSGNAAVKIFFRSRYPLQLADSWKKDSVGVADCGGIYTSSDNTGTSPLLNACKAPGLWQHLYVRFKAAKVDSAGKLISNPLFKEVYLNDKLIQKNVEVKVLADAIAAKKAGPLTIISDSGPVAFRNIRYKTYGDQRITLQNMRYTVYKGLYKKYDTLSGLSPVRTGTADSVHWGYGDKRAQIAFSGNMNVPADGEYVYKLRAGGPAWLLIDEREVVNNKNTREYTQPFYGAISLTKGSHSFKIIYANYDESLVVEYEGPGIPLTPLTVASSERHVKAIEPLEYAVTDVPGIQRGFFPHRGNVNTYTVTVGIPGGLNYAYDLTTFSLLAVWRGKFLDVSNMWTERGESQLEIPLGASLELSGIPGLLQLSEKEAAWTDTVEVDNSIYTNRDYHLTENGLPVFSYTYSGMQVEDRITAGERNNGLVRRITFNFRQPVANTYFLVGSGKLVEKLSGQRYAIDDKEYYIETAAGDDQEQPVIVKAKNDRYELLLPLSGEAGKTFSFQYSLIW
jgi:hypothetical protein